MNTTISDLSKFAAALVSGNGLDTALRGVDVVIDVSNNASFSAKQSIGLLRRHL